MSGPLPAQTDRGQAGHDDGKHHQLQIVTHIVPARYSRKTLT